MSMPKTSVYKYTGQELGHYNVGLAREVLAVQAKTITQSIKETAQCELGLCIFAGYRSHHPRSGRFIYNIHFRLPLADVAHEL